MGTLKASRQTNVYRDGKIGTLERQFEQLKFEVIYGTGGGDLLSGEY